VIKDAPGRVVVDDSSSPDYGILTMYTVRAETYTFTFEVENHFLNQVLTATATVTAYGQ